MYGFQAPLGGFGGPQSQVRQVGFQSPLGGFGGPQHTLNHMDFIFNKDYFPII